MESKIVTSSRLHRVLLTLRRAGKLGLYTWAHPSNRGKRLQAILRVLYFFVRSGLQGRDAFAKLGNRSRIIANPQRYASVKVVCANPPDHFEMQAWRRYLKGEDFFVDVGANIGTYSIWAAELGAEVLALEPAEDTYAELVANVKLNGYPIRTLRAAAGPVCGEARLTIGKDDQNRLTPSGGVPVPLLTLDSILTGRTASGVKVDVEGYELEVLRGCEATLSEHRIKLIQLEWNSTSVAASGIDREPIARFLNAYGYRLYRPDRSGLLQAIGNWEFGADVFARSES